MKKLFVFAAVCLGFLFPGTYSLPLASGKNPRLHSLLLTNTGSSSAAFTLKVNGNLSVNLADLIAQIRAMPDAPGFPGEPDYRKAWRYQSTHRYHSRPLTASPWQHNPCFILNSLGFSLCDDDASCLGMLWTNMGYPVRIWGLSGHVVSEVFAGGRWQLFDGTESVYYHLNAAHDVAGYYDLVANPSLISQPIDPFGPDAWAYTVSNLYATTADNLNVTAWHIGTPPYTKDLQFQIPAKSVLYVGGVFTDKPLVICGSPGTYYSRGISHAKLVIPANWSGTVDLPLALHDIQGDSQDSVTIGGVSYSPSSAGLDAMIIARANESTSSREGMPKPITIINNSKPMNIIYLISDFMVGLKNNNVIEISGSGASMVVPSIAAIPEPYQYVSFRLDETNGGAAADAGPHRLDGVRMGCKPSFDAVLGRSFEFDGLSNVVNLSRLNLDFFKQNNAAYTVSLWFKQATNQFYRRALFSDYQHAVELASGNRVRIMHYTNSYGYVEKYFPLASSTGTWHHVAYTYVLTNGLVQTTLYLDGVSNLGIASTPMNREPTETFLGSHGGSQDMFKGLIDEVRIDGRVLGQSEITGNYDSATNIPVLGASPLPGTLSLPTSVSLSIDRGTGYWSTDGGTTYHAFTVDGATVPLAAGQATVLVYGVNVFGKRTPTQTLKYDLEAYNPAQWTRTALNSFSSRCDHSSAVFNNKMWVIGGKVDVRTNDVYASADGTNWSRATPSAAFTGRMGHRSVVFDNRMWVIAGKDGGGYKNDVYHSTDGITWTRATSSAAFPVRSWHSALAFNGKMWVIGGYDGGYKNDVYYSTDGANWIQATAAAAFSARELHTSVVHNQKMWILGGYGTNGRTGDVYSSADGTNWSLVASGLSPLKRNWHSSTTFDNKMWVLGGTTGVYTNDVFSSADGINWLPATQGAAFSARQQHSSLVFNNKMWVIGGFDGGNQADVWRCQ